MLGSPPCFRTGSLKVELDDRSRMSREAHVRFWEGAGARFPRATRHTRHRKLWVGLWVENGNGVAIPKATDPREAA